MAPSDQWLELTDGRHAVGRVHVQYTVIAAGDEFPDDDPVPAPNSTRPLVEQRARTAGVVCGGGGECQRRNAPLRSLSG